MGFSEQTPTPSLVTLLPVFATTALLATAKSSHACRSDPVWQYPVSVGLVSYSLYLWHQPCIRLYQEDGHAGTHGKTLGPKLEAFY